MTTTEAPTPIEESAPVGLDGERAPDRATDVELIGQMEASGYRRPPALVRRSDGQVLQLTPLLYGVLELADGQRTSSEVAEALGERINRKVSRDNVEYLLTKKLEPAGLVKRADGSDPPCRKLNPLLALRLRFTVVGPELANRLAAPGVVLFQPVVVLAVVIGFGATVVWLLFVHGLADPTRQLLYSPPLLLLVLVVTMASAGFHELGHAAACRYSGARPGEMGAGLYLVWPAFYTDVTDAYRLDRRGRLRTDLGGLYFNAVFVLATVAVWRLTGAEALLVLVPLQLLQMLHQLIPLVRLDGYHILADLCGVPDLFARIRPTLLALVPGRRPPPEAQALKPWVRVVVTGWVIMVIPLLGFSLLLVAIGLPRLMATAADSAVAQLTTAGDGWREGDLIVAALGVLGAISVLLPIAGTLYILVRSTRRVSSGAWRAADRAPLGRPVLALATVAAVVALAALWWPNGEYRPIEPGERGTVVDLASAVTEVGSGRPGLSVEQEADLESPPTDASTEAPSAEETGADSEPVLDAIEPDSTAPTSDASEAGPAESTTTTTVDQSTTTTEPEPTPTTEVP